MNSNNPTYLINEAKRLVESDRSSEIKLNANGGNSILIVCDPISEHNFIAHLIDLLPSERYEIIDLNKMLVNYVTEHEMELNELYDLLQSATHEIFKAPANEESHDLFKEIITEINQSLLIQKVPVLINTGALYGTGIHNIHIMENEIVMNGALPLIILYPATVEPDRILFLGKHPASKYRCMIIQ